MLAILTVCYSRALYYLYSVLQKNSMQNNDEYSCFSIPQSVSMVPRQMRGVQAKPGQTTPHEMTVTLQCLPRLYQPQAMLLNGANAVLKKQSGTNGFKPV